MSNRLAESSSAYLRSAAHQPIEWYEFGEEAFAKAKELDRPVLLDIGAVWCHWCHVIDRESYENEEIARIINEHYIPVKVDRDQRPDIDARYQQVVVSLTGHGGWPLTGFLTHDGRVIYGGTYFPPRVMKNLLLKIKDLYQERKQEIFAQEEMNVGELDQAAVAETEALPLTDEVLENVLASCKRTYDPVHGGFGTAPKFPHFSALEFLTAWLNQNLFKPEARPYHDMLLKTLDAMADGGIYDHIAGGFHRYSVDREWHVPHFEKMAYDNAEALKVYAQAHRLTGIAKYRDVAEGIVRFVDRQLSDRENGGFYASQDADIDLSDDGDHFTWTIDEVRELLSADEAEVILRYYDIHAQGDMHERPGRNVLRVKSNLREIGELLNKSPEEAQCLFESAHAKMLERRGTRPQTYVDPSIYTNWNGMMTGAYFETADLLEWPEVRSFATRTLERLLSELYLPGERVKHAHDVDGILEDYVWLTWAALKGYYSTGVTRYLDATVDIVDLMLARFEDEALGGLYDVPKDPNALGLLKYPRKPIEDSPSSSPNGMAMQVLNQLYYLLHATRPEKAERYRISLERGLRHMVQTHGQYGFFVGALGVAAYQYLNPPLKIELLGQDESLDAAARKIFFPGKVLEYNEAPVDHPVARVCAGNHCLEPVEDPVRLRTRLVELELVSS